MGWPKGKPQPGMSKRMKALHADPEFAAKHSERMKALHADPEFAAKNRARMRALNADRATVTCANCGKRWAPRCPMDCSKDRAGNVFWVCRDVDRCEEPAS